MHSPTGCPLQLFAKCSGIALTNHQAMKLLNHEITTRPAAAAAAATEEERKAKRAAKRAAKANPPKSLGNR